MHAPAPLPDLTLDLPVPPSVNRIRRIDRASLRVVKAWHRVCDKTLLAARCRTRDPVKLRQFQGRVALNIVLNESMTAIDLSNCLKALEDYLVRIEIIPDDGQKYVRRIVLEFGYAPEGIRVTVVSLDAVCAA